MENPSEILQIPGYAHDNLDMQAMVAADRNKRAC